MRCSTFSGFLLFLTRLVLGSALFVAGWHLVFGTVTLTTEDIRTLEATDAVAVVSTSLKSPVPASTEASLGGSSLTDASANSTSSTSTTDTTADASTVGVERKGVLKLALTLHQSGLGSAEASTAVAWAAGLGQLIGGALIVIGLLTRVWATLAIIVLGGLFWFQSVQAAGMFDMNPLLWADNPLQFMQMYAQLGGIVLGLMLLRFGGGVLSMDGFIFGRPATDPAPDADEG